MLLVERMITLGGSSRLQCYLPMQLIRKLIAKQIAVTPPELPKMTAVARHGKMVLNESARLLEQLRTLSAGHEWHSAEYGLSDNDLTDIVALVQLIKDLIEKQTGVTPPKLPKTPAVAKYGKVILNESALLMEQLNTLFPGDGIATDYPDIMEEYGQS